MLSSQLLSNFINPLYAQALNPKSPILFEVPGFGPEDIEAVVENGMLKLVGQKDHPELGKIGIRRWIPVGGIAEDKIQISVKDGIMKVSLEKEEPKRIEVKVS